MGICDRVRLGVGLFVRPDLHRHGARSHCGDRNLPRNGVLPLRRISRQHGGEKYLKSLGINPKAGHSQLMNATRIEHLPRGDDCVRNSKTRHIMNAKKGSIVAAAALAGLVGGVMLTSSGCASNKAGMESGSSMNKHDCAGKNACKGQGGCKTATHSCKGKNECKGQGGCKVS